MFGHNKGSGLFSQGFGGVMGGAPIGPRNLSLVASEGFTGSGMATIGMDNSFSMIAHLPPTHNVSPYSPAVYAAYLVDSKGKNGFYAGTLKPAGNGMYQVNFRSPVPLIHYNRVVVSLESPQGIGQAPQGPIVMKVKEGMLDSLGPVKKVGSDMWGKAKGFVGNRLGWNKGEAAESSLEQQPAAPSAQMPPVQGQQPMQQYGTPQPTYGQQPAYSQQSSYPQQQVQTQQSGYPPQFTYPQGRNPSGIQQGYPSAYQTQQRPSPPPVPPTGGNMPIE